MGQFAFRIVVLSAIGTVLAVVIGGNWQGATSPRPTSDAGDVEWFCYDERLRATSAAPVKGSGHLCIGERSVKVVVDVEQLAIGDIYTAWLAYLDAPGECSATPCPITEFPRVEHPPLLSKLDVAVVDTTRQATFVCTVRGLTFGSGSQVQILVATHGSALSGNSRAHQILGARWPEREWTAASGDGVVARAHFTMRRGPE